MTLLGSPLEVLYEANGLPTFDLPNELQSAYGGSFGLAEPRVYANFVSTVDGVTAIPSLPNSNTLVAAGSASDRFVMGLLRACADAVVIGSGTLAAAPGSVWSAGQAYPAGEGPFSELRRRLGRLGPSEIVILSGSGSVDPAHPVFEAGALVLTSDAGLQKLGDRLPSTATALSLGADRELDARAVVETLTARGHRLILSEGGPRVIGGFLAAGLVDELFLTVSPLLVGRADDERFALVEGTDLLPGAEARLLGVRRDHDHLFLRYELAAPGAEREHDR